MSITFTPVWTDTATQVVTPQCLGRGSTVRGTIDLGTTPTEFGAYLFIGIGRGGTATLTNGVNVEVRRMLNTGTIRMPGCPWFAAVTTSPTVAALLKTIDFAAGYAIGTTSMVLAGAGTPAADEDYCAWGKTAIPAGGTALPNLEFMRVSAFAVPTLLIDSPCTVAKIHTEILTSKADQWCVWCPGGCTYEVIFDYGDDAAGESVAVVCYAQIYNSELGS